MVNMAPPTKTLGVTLLHKCNFNLIIPCSLLQGIIKLMDEMPDSEEFFKNMPPPPKEDKLGYPIGPLIGEDYVHKGKKAARLGNLKDLIAKAAASV